MTNACEADKAIAALNGTELGGRTLTLNEAKPKSDRPRSGGQRFGGRGDAMTTAATHVSPANRAGRLLTCREPAGKAAIAGQR
jgi:RNA recognition motif-containing protein